MRINRRHYLYAIAVCAGFVLALGVDLLGQRPLGIASTPSFVAFVILFVLPVGCYFCVLYWYDAPILDFRNGRIVIRKAMWPWQTTVIVAKQIKWAYLDKLSEEAPPRIVLLVDEVYRDNSDDESSENTMSVIVEIANAIDRPDVALQKVLECVREAKRSEYMP